MDKIFFLMSWSVRVPSEALTTWGLSEPKMSVFVQSAESLCHSVLPCFKAILFFVIYKHNFELWVLYLRGISGSPEVCQMNQRSTTVVFCAIVCLGIIIMVVLLSSNSLVKGVEVCLNDIKWDVALFQTC